MRGIYVDMSLETICSLFGKSRQGWYQLAGKKGKKQLEQNIVLEQVRLIRSGLPHTGGIKMHSMLQQFMADHQICMGRDALFALLKENGLLVKPRKMYARTTNSFHHFKKWPDLVQRRSAVMAEEIWVSDITYLRTKKGFVYLSLITDAWSRKIVGYNLSRNLKAQGCVKAFQMAVKGKIYPKRPLIHHSDRGIQYCCDEYVQLLNNQKVSISITQSGSPYDNAIAERVNGILKQEFDLYRSFATYQQAKETVDHSILSYNQKRLHFSCGLKTPQFRHASVANQDVKQNQ